jgi:hypothetical protein
VFTGISNLTLEFCFSFLSPEYPTVDELSYSSKHDFFEDAQQMLSNIHQVTQTTTEWTFSIDF